MTTSSTSRPSAPEERPTPNARRQALWNYGVFALTRSSTMIMTVVLARLLAPADFGLFALGLVMLNLFDYVRDFGVTAALVQHRDPLHRLLPTGFTVSLLFGALMAGLAVLLAPTIAHLMGHPELTAVVRVLAVALLISSFNALPQATLRRGLQFGRRLLPELSGALVKMTVAIAFAATGHGVWSLVWAQLAGSAVTTTLYWLVARPSPRMGFDRSVVAALLRFGLPVTALTFLGYLDYNLPATVIGRRLGSEAVGYWSLGFRLAELTIISLCMVIGEVLFSALARLQDDRERLVDGYLAAVGLVVAVTFPVGLGIAALAPDIVGLLYGARYAPAAAPLAGLALFATLHAAGFHSGDVYKAIGRPSILAWLSVAALVVLAPAVWVAAGHSVTAVAMTLVAVEVANLTARVLLVRRVLGPSVRRQLAIYAGPAAAAVVMGAVLFLVGRLLPAWVPAVRLGLLVPLGVAVYGAALALLAPRAFRSLRGQVARLRGQVAV